MTGTPAPPAAPYAFVSYASTDRERVAPVVAALERAGMPVWLDRAGIAGGENYALAIAEAIEGCAALVLMASAASLASRNVRQELALAWRHERPYLPLLLEPVTIPREVEYWLEAAQWVEVLDKPSPEWLPAVLAALALHGIAPVPAAPPLAATLAGRERELAGLRDRLAAALGGQGGTVLVGGEAGVGKTTLADALLAEATGRGALVLSGHCYDLSETPPYGPWLEVTGQYPAGAPGLPPLPAILTDRAALAAIVSQAALFEQVVGWFAAVAAARPLVLLLEDLHWADPASLDLLRTLARRAPALRLLLLVTYRADELTRRHPLYQLLPLLVREAHAARLDLHRLTDDAVGALVAARYALPAADTARLAVYLQARAEGNALFLGELLRALEEAGALREDGAGWALGELAGVAVPPLLHQVIDGRLARLGEEARQLLAVAAVVGHEVPLAVWAAVGGVAEDALLDVVEAGAAARLLVESPDGARVQFAHALVREALYEGTPATRRRRLHRAAGEALAATAQPDPDAVAYHFQRAGDPRAATWLVRAGERAQRGYAWVTAAARYEAALALMEQHDADPVTRARLLHTLAQLQRYTDRPRSVALLAEAATLAMEGGDTALAAAARFDRGHLLCLSLDYIAGLPEMRAALPVLEALPPGQLAALPTAIVLGLRPGESYHRGVLLMFLAFSGHLAEVDAAGLGTLALTPGIGHRAVVALALVQTLRGEVEPAARSWMAAIAAARAAGQHREVTVGLGNATAVLYSYRTDDLAARAALTAEALANLPAAREADPGLTATEVLCFLRFVEGAWGELADWAREHQDRAPWLHLLLAHLRGDASAGWAWVRAVLPDGPTTAPGTGHLFIALIAQQTAASLAFDAGDLPEACAWLEAQDRWLAWSGAVWGHAEAQLGWAAYHHASGDPAQGRKAAEHALAHATEPRQPLALMAAHRALGELDTADGNATAAQAHLDAALALAAACAAPYERALTLLALAGLRVAKGETAAARDLLAEVRAICEPLGARPALARAAALAATLADGG